MAETLTEVSGGRVSTQSRSEIEAFFEQVFAGASYEIWEDSAPPVIRISTDSTMAWVARTVRVRRYAPGPDGRTRQEAFDSAYTSTYEKRQDKWVMTSVTSTFLPR